MRSRERVMGHSSATTLQVGDEVCHVLRWDGLLQAIGHERETGGADLADVGAKDAFTDSAGLHYFEIGCRFAGDDASERASVPCDDGIARVARLHRRIRIEDGGDVIRGALV